MRKLAIVLILIMPTFALAQKADAHPSVDRWKQTALNAGWKTHHWPMVKCIIWRETGGNPNLYNPEKQAGTPKGWGSYGLMQMYGWANRDWLMKFVGGDLRKLYNPYVNLRAAKKLYDMRGWRPWGGCRR